MDDNTAAVLTSLIQMAGFSSIFWACAMTIYWQGGRVDGDEADESDDEDDEDGTDDDSEDDSDNDDNWDEEAEEDSEPEGCPSFARCPYRADMDLIVVLEDLTVRDVVTRWIIVGVGCGAVGFILGMQLA